MPVPGSSLCRGEHRRGGGGRTMVPRGDISVMPHACLTWQRQPQHRAPSAHRSTRSKRERSGERATRRRKGGERRRRQTQG
eukprot:3207279-Rhodomonas_salina.1